MSGPGFADFPSDLEGIRAAVAASNPLLYRHLALYLQVLRSVLPERVHQACFHLATQVHAARYLRLSAKERLALHRRRQDLIRRCCSLLTVEQLESLARQMVQEALEQQEEREQQLLAQLLHQAQEESSDSSPDSSEESKPGATDARPQPAPLARGQGPADLPPGSIRLDLSPPLDGGAFPWLGSRPPSSRGSSRTRPAEGESEESGGDEAPQDAELWQQESEGEEQGEEFETWWDEAAEEADGDAAADDARAARESLGRDNLPPHQHPGHRQPPRTTQPFRPRSDQRSAAHDRIEGRSSVHQRPGDSIPESGKGPAHGAPAAIEPQDGSAEGQATDNDVPKDALSQDNNLEDHTTETRLSGGELPQDRLPETHSSDDLRQGDLTPGGPSLESRASEGQAPESQHPKDQPLGDYSLEGKASRDYFLKRQSLGGDSPADDSLVDSSSEQQFTEEQFTQGQFAETDFLEDRELADIDARQSEQAHQRSLDSSDLDLTDLDSTDLDPNDPDSTDLDPTDLDSTDLDPEDAELSAILMAAAAASAAMGRAPEEAGGSGPSLGRAPAGDTAEAADEGDGGIQPPAGAALAAESFLQAAASALPDRPRKGRRSANRKPPKLPYPWNQTGLPGDPIHLLEWLEGFDKALARRLRNLSHAINVDLLRFGLSRGLLPVNLLDAVLQGQIETMASPANVLRLQLPFGLRPGAPPLQALAVLLRKADLEMEEPRLRTCRRRLHQHRQEVRRMAQLYRRLQRRQQAHEAERLWLQDIRRSLPPES